MSSGVETSLNVSEIVRDSSTPVGMTRILRSQTAAAAKHASGAPIKTLGNLIKIDNEMQTALTRNDACPPKLWRRRIEPSSSIQRSKKYKPMIDSASDGMSGMKQRLAIIPSGAKL